MDIAGFFPYPTLEAAGTAAELQFFEHGTEEEWSTLLSYTETQLFDRGATVMKRGDAGRSLYLLTDGTLELETRKRRAPPQLLTATTIFGELAFFDGLPRSPSLIAKTDGEMLRLSRDSFDSLCVREPRLGHAILLELGRILSLRVRRIEEQLADSTR